jgi:hypothetical protein
LFSFVYHTSNTEFEPLKWCTEEGERQTGVNDHRWQQHPPDIAVIFVEALVGGVLHKPTSPPAARYAPAGKEYQGNGNQIDNAQNEYQLDGY